MAARPLARQLVALACAILVGGLLIGCDTALTPGSNPPAGPALPPTLDLTIAPTTPDGRPVSDPRFAAVLVTAQGETRLYDDIGRLVAQLAAQPVAAAWVRDYERATWLPAETAVYVASPNLVTPRGSGLLAVTTPEQALLLARTLGGRTLVWDELPTYMAGGLADPVLPASGGSGLGGLLEVDR